MPAGTVDLRFLNIFCKLPFSLWCSRKNALHLEEKERIERERLQQIIDDADDYKDELIAKRKMNREANIKKNRDQEKVMGILFFGIVGFRLCAEIFYCQIVATCTGGDMKHMDL
jgi:hypothetical protein